MDELIVFHALKEDDILQIAALMLKQVQKRLAEKGMTLSYGDDAVKLLADKGYDPQYGARPLRRVIQRAVEDALSEEIISGRLRLGDAVNLWVEQNEIRFQKA